MAIEKIDQQNKPKKKKKQRENSRKLAGNLKQKNALKFKKKNCDKLAENFKSTNLEIKLNKIIQKTTHKISGKIQKIAGEFYQTFNFKI